MAHRALRDPDQEGWERADMPIVCETCLGPNPFVRMQRVEFGGLCHISNRPYTVFRWRPGADARYKKTIVCQEVAKSKNVCQVCLLDLEYNLPVQVRDQALGLTNEDEPESEVGKEFQLHQKVKEGENGLGGASSFSTNQPSDMLQRLQRTTPYYKRNQARVCSFFAKGTCTRGAECPYRHEMPTTGELANQNIKDRYYGINDPVANKMMRRVDDLPKMAPPEDPTITTLFVGGVTPDISEEDLRDHFYACGELVSIRKVDSKSCAFVTYSARAGAEKAASELSGKLIIKGQRLRLSWGKPQQERAAPPTSDPMQPSGGIRSQIVPGGYPLPGAGQGAGAAPSPTDLSAMYPSMAHDNMGTRMVGPGDAPGGAPKRVADGAPQVGTSSGYGAQGSFDASKRPRPAGSMPSPSMPPPGVGYGYPPPGFGFPQGVPPGFPPPGFAFPQGGPPIGGPPHMGPPHGGPPFGGPPPGFGGQHGHMGPPPGRPPMGAPQHMGMPKQAGPPLVQ